MKSQQTLTSEGGNVITVPCPVGKQNRIVCIHFTIQPAAAADQLTIVVNRSVQTIFETCTDELQGTEGLICAFVGACPTTKSATNSTAILPLPNVQLQFEVDVSFSLVAGSIIDTILTYEQDDL